MARKHRRVYQFDSSFSKLKYMVIVIVMGAVKHDTDATSNPSVNDGRQCERGVKEKSLTR